LQLIRDSNRPGESQLPDVRVSGPYGIPELEVAQDLFDDRSVFDEADDP
jgi:hypothetical protein